MIASRRSQVLLNANFRPTSKKFICFSIQFYTFVSTSRLHKHKTEYEDDHWQKKTLDVRHLWWNTNFNGRQHIMEDDFWWKTTFDGRHLWKKASFDERQPLVEDDIKFSTTLDGRGSLMKDNLWWKMPFHRGCFENLQCQSWVR